MSKVKLAAVRPTEELFQHLPSGAGYRGLRILIVEHSGDVGGAICSSLGRRDMACVRAATATDADLYLAAET